MGNKNLVRQKLSSMNLYAKSYAVTKFDYLYYNEKFTSTMVAHPPYFDICVALLVVPEKC